MRYLRNRFVFMVVLVHLEFMPFQKRLVQNPLDRLVLIAVLAPYYPMLHTDLQVVGEIVSGH